jgi:predicted nucleotidyltransferase
MNVKWRRPLGNLMTHSETLQEDSVLTEVVRRLVEAYRPERVYLFGSKARGDGDADSDYDLMVLVPDDSTPERRSSRLAYRALRGTGAAADVVVWLQSRFERRVRVITSLPATVMREGRLLYAA